MANRVHKQVVIGIVLPLFIFWLGGIVGVLVDIDCLLCALAFPGEIDWTEGVYCCYVLHTSFSPVILGLMCGLGSLAIGWLGGTVVFAIVSAFRRN